MDTPNQQQELSKKQQRRLEKLKERESRAGSRATKRIGGRIVVWIVILAVIGFFVYAIGKLASGGPAGGAVETDIAIAADERALGNPDAAVQLIEYADFQCPGCGAFHPIVKQLLDEYGDRIAYAYRHYPLPQHGHARTMARAAEAAGRQGKFWEMHDLIFENQSRWSALPSVAGTIDGYASQLGLDKDRFKEDFDSREIRDIVEADYRNGGRYGVNSTPTFFLGGAKLPLPRTFNEFRDVIDAALSAAAANETAATDDVQAD